MNIFGLENMSDPHKDGATDTRLTPDQKPSAAACPPKSGRRERADRKASVMAGCHAVTRAELKLLQVSFGATSAIRRHGRARHR